MPRVILKLGGSVVTDKAGDCAVRNDRIAECAGEIARRPGVQVVLVHGAGSCGHPQAHRHRLDQGVPPGDLAGIPETHHAVADLNRTVVDALRRAGREAVGYPSPRPLRGGRGEAPAPGLAAGRPHALPGPDPRAPWRRRDGHRPGASIVSGDQLVSSLARALSPDRVGLATDVPGVLGGDGAVVGRIRRGEGKGLAGGSRNTDVTGGMEGKFEELLALADAGIGSSIFHASRIGDFLDGRPHGGTTVEGGM